VTTGGRSTPWTRLDAAVWTAAMAAAVAVGAWAWWEAAGTPVLSHQVPWVSGACGAFVVATAAHGSWILRGRRRIGLRCLALFPCDDNAATGDEVTPPVLPSEARTLMAAPGLRRYHRPGCPLAQGAPFMPAERPVHESAGRLACGVCRP
jgi:hypothetical protein